MSTRRIVLLLSVCALFALIFSPLSGLAQGQLSSSSTDLAPLTTGGPDEYGYTWDDSEPLSWIDTSGGVNTGIQKVSDPGVLIDIGFPFKFYENSYTQLYIYSYGYLSFNHSTYSSYGPTGIPSQATPNDIIAPLWHSFNGMNGYVHTLKGGTDPNRWFAVEWNRMTYNCGVTNEHTFEVVLFEGSNKILFQYGHIDNWCNWYLSGIENSTGTDGLKVTDGTHINSDHAVGIYRPAPGARVSAGSLYRGSFTPAGKTADFQMAIKNIGELGADTFDLIPSTGWTTSFYASDGVTLLSDTDQDGVIDTGPLNGGATANIVTKVQAPPGANIGDASTVALTIRSALDVSKTKTVNLQIAVPAPFAQVFRDPGDQAMSLSLIQPGGQQIKPVVANWTGNEPAVAETPDGNFIYAWSKSRSIANNTALTQEIEYVLVNKYGEMLKGVTKLMDNSNPNPLAEDTSPVVAVAPDGKIGILWVRSLEVPATSNYNSNYNIFIAVLNSSGNLVYGPTSMTNNTIWGKFDEKYIPMFSTPAITATADNRFVLSWNKRYFGEPTTYCTSGCFVDDIYYAVRNTGGGQVKGITQLTFDTSNTYDGYYNPNLAALAGNKAILSWDGRSAVAGLYYIIIDSAGNLVKDKTNLGGHGDYYDDSDPDAIQLSDGKILMAWTGGSGAFIRFATLDPASYTLVSGPTDLSSPGNTTGNSGVSVTADLSGSGILTWRNNATSNLYYALVNGAGSVLTQPMVFYTALSAGPANQIATSSGYANTTYIAPDVDAVISLGGTLSGGAPGGPASINLRYFNRGRALATGVVLTATLGSGLAYLGDTSGITPTVTGDEVTWSLPDLGFLDEGQFTLLVEVPDGAVIGTRYPLTLELTTNGPENNASDNAASSEVMAAYQINLPVILR